MIQMSLLEKHLKIKKSQIPNAGKGLFTRVDIAKGERIVEYKGSLHRWVEIKHEDGPNAYIMRVSRTMAINAKPFLKTFGRYANDAFGIQRVRGLRNNSEYVTEGNKCFIEATRKIKKGEEIFVDYGEAYWDLMRTLHKK